MSREGQQSHFSFPCQPALGLFQNYRSEHVLQVLWTSGQLLLHGHFKYQHLQDLNIPYSTAKG